MSKYPTRLKNPVLQQVEKIELETDRRVAEVSSLFAKVDKLYHFVTDDAAKRAKPFVQGNLFQPGPNVLKLSLD